MFLQVSTKEQQTLFLFDCLSLGQKMLQRFFRQTKLVCDIDKK